jgi:hypothetical protein
LKPWKLTVRGKTYLVRSIILGSCLDAVEIFRSLNTLAPNGIVHCSICDFVGCHNENTTYFYRFLSNKDGSSSLISREYHDLLLQKNTVDCIFLGSSPYTLYAPTFFPPSTCFGDVLHVLYEGFLKDMFDCWKEASPQAYNNMISICNTLKIPRQDSHYNTKVDTKFKAKDYKFFLFFIGQHCLKLAGFEEKYISNFKILIEIVEKLDAHLDNNLTVGDIFELYKKFLEWTKKFARLFSAQRITSKVHQFEHAILQVKQVLFSFIILFLTFFKFKRSF